MADTPYSNRELDQKFETILGELQHIKRQTTATNGKVRKIIVALVFAFGLIMGIGAQDFGAVIEFLV